MTAVIFAVSCNKEIVPEELPDQNLPEVTYVDLVVSASADMHYQDPQSKTQLGTDGLSILWKKGDALSVFDGTSNNQFTTTITEPSASASFSGKIAANATDLYALYPYRDKATLTGSKISTFLSNEQNALVKDFANSAVPLVAKATIQPNADAANPQAVAFQFKNICNLLKIEIPTGLEVHSILIEGNNGELIAGEFDVDMASGTPVITVTKGETIVKLSANGGTMAAGVYYAAILPVNFTKGLNITFTSGDGATYKQQRVSGSNALDVSALNKIQPLRALPTDAPEICNNYLKWNDGQDINVGGVMVNKTMYPKATYITKHSTVKDINNANGLFFVDSDVVGANVLCGNNVKLCIIGNDDSQRVTLSRPTDSKRFTLKETGSILLKNIKYVPENKDDHYFGTNGNADALVLDNCEFELLTGKSLIYASANNNIANFTMVNTDCKIGEAKTIICSIDKSISGNGTFKAINNVFYSDTECNEFFLYNSSGVNAKDVPHTPGVTLTNTIVEDNTLVNLYVKPAGLIHAEKFTTNVSVKNNLFYMPKYGEKSFNSKANKCDYIGILRANVRDFAGYPKENNVLINNNFVYREDYAGMQTFKATDKDLKKTVDNKETYYTGVENVTSWNNAPFELTETQLTVDMFKVTADNYGDPNPVGATR